MLFFKDHLSTGAIGEADANKLIVWGCCPENEKKN